MAFPSILLSPSLQTTSEWHTGHDWGFPSLLLFPFLGLVTAHKQATGVGQLLLIPYGKNENCIPKLKTI